MPEKPSEEITSEDTSSNTAASNHENDLTLTDCLNKKLLSSLLERMNSGTHFDRFITQNEPMNPAIEDDFAP
jgi:hypothetical protein